MTVHIGVTGHRHLADPDAVSDAVDAVLDEVCPIGHRDPVEVISGLAEGADRLVTDRVLARPPSTVHAVLPLPAADYRNDFPDTASAFDAYLADACAVDVARTGGGDRDEAYEVAGRWMVDLSDVVIAVWDGQQAAGRGGTAEIVEYARTRDVAVRVVSAMRAAGHGSSSGPGGTPEPPCS